MSHDVLPVSLLRVSFMMLYHDPLIPCISSADFCASVPVPDRHGLGQNVEGP